DRVQAGEALETVSEGARIEQDPSAVQFHEDAGMTEVGNAHTATLGARAHPLQRCGGPPRASARVPVATDAYPAKRPLWAPPQCAAHTQPGTAPVAPANYAVQVTPTTTRGATRGTS